MNNIVLIVGCNLRWIVYSRPSKKSRIALVWMSQSHIISSSHHGRETINRQWRHDVAKRLVSSTRLRTCLDLGHKSDWQTFLRLTFYWCYYGDRAGNLMNRHEWSGDCSTTLETGERLFVMVVLYWHEKVKGSMEGHWQWIGHCEHKTLLEERWRLHIQTFLHSVSMRKVLCV